MSRSEYDELRTGFTAAVSHELRTPLARLLALLETAELPGADLQALLRQARDEVVEMTELVDDILFLSELEQDREVVSLGETEAAPVLREVVAELSERAELAGIWLELRIEDEGVLLPLRRRMLQIVVENLLVNVIRYAGEGANCTLSLRREGERGVSRSRTTVSASPTRTSPALRALLPLRPSSHHARERSRSCDRQARHRVCRRERRSPRRAEPRARRSVQPSDLS